MALLLSHIGCIIYRVRNNTTKGNTMKQKIELLKELLVIIEEMNGTHDFIGKDDVQQRLRWTAKSLAEQIHDKRLDLTVSA